VDAIGVHGQSNIDPIVDQEERIAAYFPKPEGFIEHFSGFGILVPVLHGTNTTGIGQLHITDVTSAG
jgi:hypothetical protein